MSFFVALLLAQAGAAPVATDCANAVVQQELNYCAAQDFHAADAALNAQWAITAAEMRRRDDELTQTDREVRREDWSGHFATLLAAQRAWLIYRDNHCDSEGYAAFGGSMEPMQVAFCRAALTRQRTQQLLDLTRP
jgi:uncharacterized protein YecT (DUF1311 family)